MTLMGSEPELGLGDSGEFVYQLQDRLRALGLLDKLPDGSFDDATESAVRQFQSDVGQGNDGRLTASTWQALDDRMLGYGLHYNPAAGPGNQHWDQPAGADPAAADPAAADAAGGQLSEDGHWRWDGAEWQPVEAGAAADPVPVVPHIDNIHPAIRDDERLSSFHDFLRETHGA
jgi:peptidoglycan hydrolase-like protein with peptidoglycan-binding domain